MAADYQLGFISANHVARVDGYDSTSLDDWGDLEARTREEFEPEALDAWLGEVADVGFEGVSLWTPHCPYHTATDDEVETVVDIAREHGLEIYSYAGGFAKPPAGREPDPARDWARTFETAAKLGCGWLSGGCDPDERAYVAECTDEYGVGFAYENHPEGSVEEIRGAIAGYEDVMGVAFDTGWAGTQGFDAAGAIRELDDLLLEVHLKDVEAEGGHETCALGEGVVDVEGCLRALEEIAFDGWVSIEHEPLDRDPMPEVETSFERVQSWRA